MSLCRLENSAIEKLFFVIIVKAVVVEGICFFEEKDGVVSVPCIYLHAC